jgi:hypothetical protein
MHGRHEKWVQGFGGEPEGKTPYRRLRCRWEEYEDGFSRIRMEGCRLDLFGWSYGPMVGSYEHNND